MEIKKYTNDEDIDAFLNQKIQPESMSVKTYNALKRKNIFTYGDIVDYYKKNG